MQIRRAVSSASACLAVLLSVVTVARGGDQCDITIGAIDARATLTINGTPATQSDVLSFAIGETVSFVTTSNGQTFEDVIECRYSMEVAIHPDPAGASNAYSVSNSRVVPDPGARSVTNAPWNPEVVILPVAPRTMMGTGDLGDPLVPAGGITFYTNEATFNAALPAAHTELEGTETFEEAVLQDFIMPTCDPLHAACNDGIFSTGDILAGVAFQSNWNGPGMTKVIGHDMAASRPPFLSNKAVGPGYYTDSFDILSSNPDHTAMAMWVVDHFATSASSMQVRVFGASNSLLGSTTVSIGNGTFIGFIAPPGSIDRVNLYTPYVPLTTGTEFLYGMNTYVIVPYCGDGSADPGEDCDDGNANETDACHNDCTFTCGDGVICDDPGTCTGGPAGGVEECDDGSANSEDPDAGCRTDCANAGCGDGVTDPGTGEDCDDANANNTDSCHDDCSANTCGDGVICDDAGTCTSGPTGDTEDCDDGNGNDTDACHNDCSINTCGDGVICDDAATCTSGPTGVTEECDEGAANSEDPDATCRTDCANAGCGDGVTDPGTGEECDDGNENDWDDCHNDCTVSTCGDGVIDPGEECDGDNAAACAIQCLLDCTCCPDDDTSGGADGFCDSCIGTVGCVEDNCPDDANPDQADCSGDGVGDACAPDSDNDGVPDSCETGITIGPIDAGATLTVNSTPVVEDDFFEFTAGDTVTFVTTFNGQTYEDVIESHYPINVSVHAVDYPAHPGGTIYLDEDLGYTPYDIFIITSTDTSWFSFDMDEPPVDDAVKILGFHAMVPNAGIGTLGDPSHTGTPRGLAEVFYGTVENSGRLEVATTCMSHWDPDPDLRFSSGSSFNKIVGNNVIFSTDCSRDPDVMIQELYADYAETDDTEITWWRMELTDQFYCYDYDGYSLNDELPELDSLTGDPMLWFKARNPAKWSLYPLVKIDGFGNVWEFDNYNYDDYNFFEMQLAGRFEWYNDEDYNEYAHFIGPVMEMDEFEWIYCDDTLYINFFGDDDDNYDNGDRFDGDFGTAGQDFWNPLLTNPEPDGYGYTAGSIISPIVVLNLRGGEFYTEDDCWNYEAELYLADNQDLLILSGTNELRVDLDSGGSFYQGTDSHWVVEDGLDYRYDTPTDEAFNITIVDFQVDMNARAVSVAAVNDYAGGGAGGGDGDDTVSTMYVAHRLKTAYGRQLTKTLMTYSVGTGQWSASVVLPDDGEYYFYTVATENDDIYGKVVEHDVFVATDGDSDGVADFQDNCPNHANPDQSDCDGDGAGDVCALATGQAEDCNANSEPDDCELAEHLDIAASLASLDANSAAISALIPDRRDFTGGDSSDDNFCGASNNNIGYGSWPAMYYCGNYLNTDVASRIPYTDGVAETSSAFGSDSRYFTAKYTGLFVLGVSRMNVDTFFLGGTTITQGDGSVDGTVLSTTVGGRDYTVLVKRSYGASYAPSINHMIVIPGDGSGQTHSFRNDTYDDFHEVSGLAGIREMYYLLASRVVMQSPYIGLPLEDADVLNVVNEFLTNLAFAEPAANCDGDAMLDDCEDDGDGDGTIDDCDRCAGFDDALDDDGDGVPDGCDVCPGSDDNIDGDGDGVPDDCDPCPADNPDDSDGDGVCDSDDVCTDADEDGYGDGDNGNTGCAMGPETDCDDTNPNIFPGAPETCNGADDDCDGQTDEGFPTVGDTCDSADSDLCENGTLTCNAAGDGVECVNETVTDIAETCNGADDDCDGQTDETFPTLGAVCDGADSDLCENGTLTCNAVGDGVECVNETVTNITETCNGLDDDCDGDADEDFPTVGAACDGSDSDLCENGISTCNAAGDDVECVNETVTDISETCNGADDDCDGQTDEDFPTLGDVCDGSDNDLCEDGTLTCNVAGDGVECINEPGDNTEACNGLDDNCDGSIDEGFGGHSDADSFGDDCDNCPNIDNQDQVDTDGDGVGDICDNCPTTANTDQEDSNGNGVGNACTPSAPPTPAPLDRTHGVGFAGADGRFTGTARTSDGRMLARIVVEGAVPGTRFAFALDDADTTAGETPGPDGGAIFGFADGVGMGRTLTAETSAEPGTYTVAVSITFTAAELAAAGLAPEDIQLHVLDTTVDPPMWVPAGVDIGLSEPTGAAGDAGFLINSDGSVTFWAVRDALSDFAVGAAEEEPPPAGEEPTAGQPVPDDEPTPDGEEPQVDEDEDGVLDDVDLCLGTAPGVSVDAFGCVIEVAPEQTTPPACGAAPCGVLGMLSLCPMLMGVAQMKSSVRRKHGKRGGNR